MLNKKSIKNILNVKHTCIDNVTMLADTSIMRTTVGSGTRKKNFPHFYKKCAINELEMIIDNSSEKRKGSEKHKSSW